MAVVDAPRSLLDFLRHCGGFLRVIVAEVLGEDEKIPAFFDGLLGYVQKPSLVRFATTTESLRRCLPERHSRGTHLETRGHRLPVWETRQ
jgi:hypothetical protein